METARVGRHTRDQRPRRESDHPANNQEIVSVSIRELHEGTTRTAAWALSITLTCIDNGPLSPALLALAGITVYFANNICNALFFRTVTFPIRVSPKDRENYELARVFSAGYSIVLWLMLVIVARWHAGDLG